MNLIPRGDEQGTPIAEMTHERYLHTTTVGLLDGFPTARAAARHMAP